MNPNRAFAKVVAKTVEDARKSIDGPRCAPLETAALTNAALIAIRELAKAAGAAGKETMIGQWRRDYDSLAKSSASRAEFLERFVLLTDSFDSTAHVDLPLLCLIEASKNAAMAAYNEFSRELRLDAFRDAGIAIGALAILLNPAEIESELRRNQSRRLTDARHKDHRADRAHVWQWLEKNRAAYGSDSARADAIIESNQVSLKRSTIARLITEWNREQRNKKA